MKMAVLITRMPASSRYSAFFGWRIRCGRRVGSWEYLKSVSCRYHVCFWHLVFFLILIPDAVMKT